MSEALSADWMAAEQDQRISEAVKLERGSARNFIRRRVPDERDAEDILQEVFYELVEAYRMMKPIEQGERVALPSGAESDHRSLPQEKARGTRE